MRKISIIILVSFFIFFTFANTLLTAAKKPLTHSVYEEWKYLIDPQISPDAKYISYEINPMRGDGYLVFHETSTGIKDSIPRGDRSEFSSNSDYAAFIIEPRFSTDEEDDKQQPDSLGIYIFAEDSLKKIPNLKEFELAEDSSSFMAFLYEDSSEVVEDTLDKKEPIEKLVIINPAEMFYEEFARVNNFDISKDGSMIAFSQTTSDSTDSCLVIKYETKNKTSKVIYRSSYKVEEIKIDKIGKQIAFIAASDTITEKYHIALWQEGKKMPFLLDPFMEIEKRSWTVGTNEDLAFSGDNKKLFFGITIVNNYEKSSKRDIDYNLELWHWKDKRIQSYQKEHLKEELEREYLTCYNIEKEKYIQIEDSTSKFSSIEENGPCNYAINTSHFPYQISSQWTSPSYRDYYLVNLNTGKRRKVVEKTQSYYRLSPANKFIYWFDREQGVWFAEATETAEKYNLTGNIDVNFFNDEYDRPKNPYAYGIAGWTENDKYILVYDKYDIWKIDPKMSEKPLKLTNGRDNSIIYRYADIDKNNLFVENNIYLVTFNDKNKKDGYSKLNITTADGPEKLIYGDYIYYYLQEAKRADRLIWRKMSFAEYGDLYQSDEKFQNIEKISNLDAQEEKYIWGTSELVEWKTPSGKELQGILYKPEDFDSTKQYPLIVKIYEKTSDRLHSHYTVRPSRSIVNYPFYLSNGYLIFKPDIKYDVGTPGEDAREAVVSGVKGLLKKGIIDKNHIGLVGHSWGGYEAAYIITQTDMFAAAMAGAPVSNMTSAYGGIRWGSGKSRQNQYEVGQSRMGESLWENRRLYIKNSPLFYADSINTPLLILHNDRDGAVPWTQGIELFLGLRRLQKPVWMLNYTGEKHSLRKWNNRIDYTKRLFQYFNHFLKDRPAPAWLKYGIPATKKAKYDGYELTE